jgi:chitin synthase
MNVVSWGTREVPKRKTKKEIEEEEKERKEKEEKKKQGWFSQFMPKFQLQDLRAFMDISKKEDKSANILEQMNNLERLILDSKGKSELTEVLIDKKGILTKPRRSVKFSEETQIEDEAEQKRTEEDEYLYQKERRIRNDLVNPKWLEIEEFHPGTVVQMNNEESTFWENFIKK